ncbi:MAG: hypothetical protein Q4G05_01675 [Clostridia bacterium]|nr:hypothetical protein [Clostridia bacterium]
MRKTILTILFCGVIIFGITGCGNKTEFDIGNKSDIQISEQDVSLTIKEDTLKNTGATLVLKNFSDKTLKYDEVYEIEIEQDNEWYKINVEIDFNDPLWEVEQNESNELELKWEHGYGKLATGTYRIIKEVYFENDSEEKFYVSAEFTIQ